ncbi:hypothetical protein BDN70DRAFT_893649 [Pholiota conissans]|uniref:Uncharacterized protein n=1 Tax=Pholiota conissans TaxID=109636 RepID=A0A9P5Z5L6_9AGAR|nr:hypothetical protein BDN70DRAFT_893649 [Pholiota conissans]
MTAHLNTYAGDPKIQHPEDDNAHNFVFVGTDGRMYTTHTNDILRGRVYSIRRVHQSLTDTKLFTSTVAAELLNCTDFHAMFPQNRTEFAMMPACRPTYKVKYCTVHEMPPRWKKIVWDTEFSVSGWLFFDKFEEWTEKEKYKTNICFPFSHYASALACVIINPIYISMQTLSKAIVIIGAYCRRATQTLHVQIPFPKRKLIKDLWWTTPLSLAAGDSGFQTYRYHCERWRRRRRKRGSPPEPLS